MLPNPLIVPDCGPFLLPGGKTGCLLIHGFSAMPAEMKDLANHLHREGYTVLSVRLAGHATHPRDMMRVEWSDWLVSIEEGLTILNSLCDQVFVIGQSLGGALALHAAARYSFTGAVAISTPFGTHHPGQFKLRLAALGRKMIRKKAASAPPPLAERLEANYPAYPSFPASITIQTHKTIAALPDALPDIHMPVLLVASVADRAVPADSSRKIHALLNTPYKRIEIFEGMDHSMVCDPRRAEVFELISAFLQEILSAHES